MLLFIALRKIRLCVKKANTLLTLLKHVHLRKTHTNKPKPTNYTKQKTCLLTATTQKPASRESVIFKNHFTL